MLYDVLGTKDPKTKNNAKPCQEKTLFPPVFLTFCDCYLDRSPVRIHEVDLAATGFKNDSTAFQSQRWWQLSVTPLCQVGFLNSEVFGFCFIFQIDFILKSEIAICHGNEVLNEI